MAIMSEFKSAYSTRLLTPEDNEKMLELLKASPIESGDLSICFDRQPDIFIMANLKYKPAKYIGLFIGDRLIGFGLVGYHIGMFNSTAQEVYHLSNIFVDKEYRGRGFLLRAHRMFFEEVLDKSLPGYAVIMKGNKNAERYIGWQSKKYPYMPKSSLLSEYDVRNIIITTKKRESKEVVRKATGKDIGTIISLLKDEFSNRLFAPDISDVSFQMNIRERPDFSISNYYVVERNSQVIGVCAAWDCSSFKQIRILKYSRKFRLIKNGYNLIAPLLKLPRLPYPGQAFKAIYITDVSIKNRDPRVFNALLRKVYNEYKQKEFNLIVLGSYKNDQLLDATNDFFYQSVESNVYLYYDNDKTRTEIEQNNRKPYIDIAFL